MNYYNENDPKAAAWLRELMNAGLIPAGEIDTRSITDVRPTDLSGFTQCHFFAGIGGWSLALELAGWPVDRPVWTGSCPCQPFSAAGKQLGEKDERHLWPAFYRLIRKCAPATVFGEQVASKDALRWLDGVFADLEGAGYACGACDLCAAGVGAPHIRQRLFWVADTVRSGRPQRRAGAGGGSSAGSCGIDRLGDAGSAGTRRNAGAAFGAEGEGRGKRRADGSLCGDESVASGDADRLGHSIEPRLEGHAGDGVDRHEPGRIGAGAGGSTAEAGGAGAWSDFEIVWCRDPRGGAPVARRFEPGAFPLADGLPGRVGLLRGYGNAIVPQVAAEFIAAFLETMLTKYQK